MLLACCYAFDSTMRAHIVGHVACTDTHGVSGVVRTVSPAKRPRPCNDLSTQTTAGTCLKWALQHGPATRPQACSASSQQDLRGAQEHEIVRKVRVANAAQTRRNRRVKCPESRKTIGLKTFISCDYLKEVVTNPTQSRSPQPQCSGVAGCRCRQ
jgi:hypothetical protein